MHEPYRAAAGELAAAALTLARRFAGGATLWCVSPEWPSHGRHVAVEFVHPVIVGTRALPAVHLDGDDLTADLRVLARPGDVLLALSSADDPLTGDLIGRTAAWGLTSLWVGAGPRPRHSRADHLVWLDVVDPAWAARSGDLVLLYHLLWELTHVVFEHPGLLEPDRVGTEEVCITCADDGRVAEVQAVHHAGRADVLVGGRVETIDVSLIDPVAMGELVLVHAGVAISPLRSRPPSSGPGDRP
jgi:hydrogenase maturation factor